MKKIPKFKNEDEEREFRATRDSSAHIDRKKAKRAVLPGLAGSILQIEPE